MINLGKTRLAARIFLLVFIFAAVPLLLISVITYRSFSGLLREHIQNKLIAISDGRQRLFGELFDGILNLAKVKAKSPTPVSAFEKIDRIFKKGGIQGAEYLLLDAKLKDIFQVYFDANPQLNDFMFISREGDVIFSMRHENDLGENIHGALLGNTALPGLMSTIGITASPSISEFSFYPPSGQPALFIGAPVFIKERYFGALVFQVRLEMIYGFVRNYSGLPKTGEVVLGKAVGDQFIIVAPTRYDPQAAFRTMLDFGGTLAEPLQMAIAGKTGIGVRKDYKSTVVLARWQYVPILDWGMVVKVDVNEIFQPLYRMRNIYIIFFCLFTGLIAVVSYMFARNISKPIKIVREGLKIIGSGNLDYKIGLRRLDEIGELSGDVDKMAGRLKETTASRDELNEANRKLDSANKELEAFSYSVSHDLRAPLRGMDGFSKALLDECTDKLGDSGKEYLMRVRAAAKNMSELIDDLLELSRISRKDMVFETVNLNRIAEEVMAGLKEQEPERQVDFFSPGGLTARGDARLVEIALQNLLGNAWKFTSKHKSAKIEFGTMKSEGRDAYFIRDDGAGFDAAYYDKLFNPFQRLHSEKEFPGTGIGLATVRRIMERHGGRIWAESEVGKGATFYFTLNEKKEAAA